MGVCVRQAMIQALLIALSVLSLALGYQGIGIGLALTCPDHPKQISKDFEGEVNTQVGKLGPVSGGELKIKAKQTTRDLLEKANEMDRVYLEQMMYASYCSTLHADKSLSEGQRGERIAEYNREVRKTLRPQVPPSAVHENILPAPRKAPPVIKKDVPIKPKEIIPEQTDKHIEKTFQTAPTTPIQPKQKLADILDRKYPPTDPELERRPKFFLKEWLDVIKKVNGEMTKQDLQTVMQVRSKTP
jgi:hypothetical protein